MFYKRVAGHVKQVRHIGCNFKMYMLCIPIHCILRDLSRITKNMNQYLNSSYDIDKHTRR